MWANPDKLILPLQLGVAVLSLALLAMWPPATGRLMLTPVAGGDINHVASVAIAGGALLLGPGPLSGSLVVVGDRARISRQIGRWDMVMTAAPPAGCGALGLSA